MIFLLPITSFSHSDKTLHMRFLTLLYLFFEIIITDFKFFWVQEISYLRFCHYERKYDNNFYFFHFFKKVLKTDIQYRSIKHQPTFKNVFTLNSNTITPVYTFKNCNIINFCMLQCYTLYQTLLSYTLYIKSPWC